MKRASYRLLAPAAGLLLACSGGGSGGPRENDARRLVQPKHDALLGPARGRVLLLGTYDFPNALAHDETDRVVAKLIEFRPTKIAVGVPAAKQAALDERYKAYLHGKHDLGNGAVDRIALPLAKALKLPRVWGIGALPREASPIDVGAWAADHGQAERLHSDIVERYERWSEREREVQANETLEDNLVWLNDARHLAAAHGRNLVAEFDVGEGEDYPGPDALTAWYNRNLRIFANLQRSAAHDGERILVVIDAAHVSLLRHSVEASPLYDLVEVNEFLGRPQGAERQVVPLL